MEIAKLFQFFKKVENKPFFQAHMLKTEPCMK